MNGVAVEECETAGNGAAAAGIALAVDAYAAVKSPRSRGCETAAGSVSATDAKADPVASMPSCCGGLLGAAGVAQAACRKQRLTHRGGMSS